MKNLLFLVALFAISSCGRQNLNYQSSHQNGYPDNNQTNYTQAPQNNNQQQDYNNNVDYNTPSYQTFYDELSPYGNWVSYPNYGYVWVPNAGPGFSPYCSNGQWVYSTYGWTWASDYSWGWAPFHYGRWMQDPMYGWMWVPGNQWGPAWVTWGQTNGYYGWAPMAPGAAPGYMPAAQYWTYVPQQRIMQPNVSNYAINSYSANYGTYVNYNTVNVINNHNTYNQVTYNSGPQPNEVATVIGTPITPVTINTTAKPVINGSATSNQLNLYRPAISSTTINTATPVHVMPVQNLKQVNNNVAPSSPKPQPAIRNNNSQPVKPVTPVKQVPAQPIQNERPVEPIKEQPRQVQPMPAQNNNPRPAVQQNKPVNKPQPKPKPQQPKPAPPKKN